MQSRIFLFFGGGGVPNSTYVLLKGGSGYVNVIRQEGSLITNKMLTGGMGVKKTLILC